jgi:parallel beta-helix repeat protein
MTVADHGPGSLRDAIMAADKNGGNTTINFKIPGKTPHVISLKSSLPDVTVDNVKIDATAQQIELDGAIAGNTDGIVLAGNHCTVMGLDILNFESAGILVEGADDAVENDLIGIDLMSNPGPDGNGVYVFQATGTTIDNNDIEYNTEDGIQVFDSAGVTIGDNTLENNVNGVRVLGELASSGTVSTLTSNIIDQNLSNGVDLVDSSNNVIGGPLSGDQNYIGSDPQGHTDEGNSGDGIRIETIVPGTSANNTVVQNYIAGNGGNGVTLDDGGTSQNNLVNNYIGQSLKKPMEGTPVLFTLPNQGDGVAVVDGATDNVIGGTGLFLNGDRRNGAGNLISGNMGSGVRLSDPGTTGNLVQGNLIGTDAAGTSSIPNGGFGVAIANGASANLIGGTGSVQPIDGQGNLISGNKAGGIDISDVGTNQNLVEGNFIGTDVTGLAELANSGSGAIIEKGASANTVDLNNLISGNTGNGVFITGALTTGNIVQENLIGTDNTGSVALANLGDGVLIAGGATSNMIGGVSGSVTLGNLISGNQGNGVSIIGSGTTGNLVQGNTIGTDFVGKAPVPNANGVVIGFGAASNTVGGNTSAASNQISGNNDSGVVIVHAATANVVEGNKIGTNSAGSAAVGNGQFGVALQSSGNALLDNLISGNRLSGVALIGSQNMILRNQIGTDVWGKSAVPNKNNGILIDISTGPGANSVGGTAAGAGNLISGNAWNGIDIEGPASAGSLIEGNDIGTIMGGSSALPNLRNGILIENTTGYTIGGTSAGATNVISGNMADGIQITGAGSSGILIEGNRIGTDVAGTSRVPNQGNGVDIQREANHDTVGGTGALAGNVISGNNGDGVLLRTGAYANLLVGNQIGMNAAGTLVVFNGGNGVHILACRENIVGGATGGTGNLISGNGRDGVRIEAGASGNIFLGNLIGTDGSGLKAVFNGGDGVDIRTGSSGNEIGGTNTSAAMAGNVINNGVVISDAGTDHNVLQGNYIGTTLNGLGSLHNPGDGVDVRNGAAENQIGGPGGAGNLISANGRDGIEIWGVGTSFNSVEGNLIGTNVSGHSPLGNRGHGVFVFGGAQHNNIGGAAPVSPNVIAWNGLAQGPLAKAGVAIGANAFDATTLYNSILSNRIFANGRLGIDLGDDGPTVNSPGGPHVGHPNDFQNFPMIVNPVAVGLVSHIGVTLNSIKGASFVIQVFKNSAPDPTGYGEGFQLIDEFMLNTDPKTGNGSMVVTVPQNLAGQYITATATDAAGNTSEFSLAVRVVAKPV